LILLLLPSSFFLLPSAIKFPLWIETLEIETKNTMKKLGLRFSLMMIIGFGMVGIARSQQTPPPSNSYTQTVKREVLASGYPSEAEDKILELVRYTIPAGAKLPVHIHPGMQIEKVESGALTYTVVKGTAKITRANGKEETLEAGKTTRLTVGDSLVEPGGMVHYGNNETREPVILLGASLFDSQKPKAISINP
jgi:quercetin dioxygenase-like cupin family protein